VSAGKLRKGPSLYHQSAVPDVFGWGPPSSLMTASEISSSRLRSTSEVLSSSSRSAASFLSTAASRAIRTSPRRLTWGTRRSSASMSSRSATATVRSRSSERRLFPFIDPSFARGNLFSGLITSTGSANPSFTSAVCSLGVVSLLALFSACPSPSTIRSVKRTHCSQQHRRRQWQDAIRNHDEGVHGISTGGQGRQVMHCDAWKPTRRTSNCALPEAGANRS
jgi:hypothetical protein